MAEQGFTLTSPEFAHGEVMPASLTCDGANKSPRLQWIHPPRGTHSLALIVEDPDAPGGTFTHWVLFDIPAQAGELPAGARGVGVSGRNDFQQECYGGPCPPPNHGEHRYVFKLFALDVPSLGLEAGSPPSKVQNAMQGHVLGEAEWMGRYQRKTG